ncbi:methyltransferase domain-containing protein [Prochlorococcus sp. MIT 1307]|uniref:methyltransferase domain-containing protein n=1 Tax=Prochlorococcus sp. MIT 1307 TaxID=3096219 RepID=UPI002A75413E|nr:methyltransferase domain-containing protein [Prochlorococcus sp. MIT 1307]
MLNSLLRLALETKVKVNYYFSNIYYPWKTYKKSSIDNAFYNDDKLRYRNYSSKDKFINLGAGSTFYHPRWTCLDFYKNGMNKIFPNYIPWDFTLEKPLPGLYKLVYCSHVFEHIPKQSSEKFIDNIFNSMQPGGILRMTLPDADLGYEAYSEGRYDVLQIWENKIAKSGINVDKEYYFEFLLLHCFATSKTWEFTPALAKSIRKAHKILSKSEFLDLLISGINSNVEDGQDHVNWFNYTKLEKLLIDKGFSKVYRSAYGQSKSPAMRDVPLFDEFIPCMTLYIEAVK